jgi:hypothetical protein
MNAISGQRFEALAGYSRQPTTIPILEREWYEVQNERLLGLIILEGIDEEFGGIVLGRDGNGRFRWVAGTAFFDNIEAAREALRIAMDGQANEPDASFHQGDEFRRSTALLTPLVPEAQMGTLFQLLVETEAYSSAKGLIDALSPYFRDLDGNFIQQFQTTAFDARIFELYLFAMLHEIGYAFDQSENAPDYHCVDPWSNFFVEAVTVQPTEGMEPPPVPTTPEEFRNYTEGYAAIKFGSALFSKLRKKYWERPHVAGNPLVLAVQDFSGPLSMMRTSTALADYLYGWRHEATRDSEGHLVITPSRIGEHRYGEKVIPSDFFALPEAEHISAVIHNPHATLSKFNRMGVLAGFGSNSVRLIRKGVRKDHNPDASEPTPFTIDVRDPNYSETWVEGLSVYHNPRALLPLDPDLFPGSAHHFIREDGMIDSYTPEYFPMASVTLNVELRSGDAALADGDGA